MKLSTLYYPDLGNEYTKDDIIKGQNCPIHLAVEYLIGDYKNPIAIHFHVIAEIWVRIGNSRGLSQILKYIDSISFNIKYMSPEVKQMFSLVNYINQEGRQQFSRYFAFQLLSGTDFLKSNFPKLYNSWNQNIEKENNNETR